MATIVGALNNQYLEAILGTSGDDDIYPRGGWDVVDGDGGYNVVHVQGNKADYKIGFINGVYYIDSISSASASIQDTELKNIQLIQFDDQSVDLTTPINYIHQPGGSHFYGYGGIGIDTVSYDQNLENYTLSKSGNVFVVTDNIGNGGVDVLTSIERLYFNNAKVALDLNGNAGDVVKIVGAVFGAAALKDHPEYIGIGLGYRDAGMSYSNLTSLALNAANLNNPQAVVSQLWMNVMHQTASAADMQPFLQMLSNGTSAAEIGVLAANSSQNLISINFVGLSNSGVIYT